jgi:hypothetical protein
LFEKQIKYLIFQRFFAAFLPSVINLTGHAISLLGDTLVKWSANAGIASKANRIHPLPK